MGKTYYTPTEAAAALGVTSEHLVRLVRAQKLHVRQDNRGQWFPAEEVDALAADLTDQPARYGGAPADEDIDLRRAGAQALAGSGGGSGLLELTRERYEASLGNVRDPVQMVAPPRGKAEAADGPATQSPESPRQESEQAAPPEEITELQIGRTALSMAKKLTETHEAQLKRTRRAAAMAWIAVVALLAVAAAGWWRGVGASARAALLADQIQDGKAQLQEFKDRLDKAEAHSAKLLDELVSTREDSRRLQTAKDQLQTDVSAARQALAESEASVQVLSAKLSAAEAKVTELNAALSRAQADAEPATQPSTRPADEAEGP